MRYYFHLHDGSKLNLDPVGLNCSLNDAWVLATAVCRQAEINHPNLGPTAHVMLMDEVGTAYLIACDTVPALLKQSVKTKASRRQMASA